MKKAVTADKIRKIDILAQTKYLIPSIILMENAGIAASSAIFDYASKAGIKTTAIFCGKGNNGGDGFVIARHLACYGLNCKVFIIGKIQDIKKPDPKINLQIIQKMKIPVVELDNLKAIKKIRKRFSCDLIVDAIFGTGFSGKLPGDLRTLVDFLNNTELPIFAVDVPSGLDATTGEIKDLSINAFKTITFGLMKTGLLKNDGPSVCGEVLVRNISYPKDLL